MPSSELSALGLLFDSLPLGLVVLDESGKVIVYNRAEEQLAGRSRHKVLGCSFFDDVAPCMDVRQLGGEFRNRIGRSTFDTTVEMSFPNPVPGAPRDVKIRMCSLDVGARPFGFLMIEDISLRRSVDRMREQLQSLLVHDLKNPLAAITLNLELMSELASVRDSSDAMDSLVEALAATRRLNRMTIDLLDISRLETATMPLRRTRIHLGRMLARVCNDNAAAARIRGARVHVTPADVGDVEIDEDLVVRALDNLVENAIRHAANVTLSAAWDGDRLVLRVRDDGPGVPPELRERLFDKYVQVQPTARGINRGLGLTFVKLVAQQHGGAVELVCPEEGGTVITLSLAAQRPAAR